MDSTPSPVDARELLHLKSLARHYPTVTSAVAEIAYLKASLTLPKPTVHVISDIHGEAKKLLHVLHNASGSLRPAVERLFKDRLSPEKIRELLTVIYYPREAFQKIQTDKSGEEVMRFFRRIVRLEFEVMREAAQRSTVRQIDRTFPENYRELFREFFFERGQESLNYADAMLDTLVEHGEALEFLRHVSRTIRYLTVGELIAAGDCGDRGTRIDRVIDYIMHQSNVSVTWGNHDVTWMGACLGDPLLIATVLRLSLRYRRLSQLEEGYGIIMSPLEKLARTCYGDDPAAHFMPKGEGLRETVMMARMQKAISVIQFKLEGQTILRNPDYRMKHRNVLANVDFRNGTYRASGTDHPLLDSRFPTVDPDDPLALSEEEQACMERIRKSFLASDKLWQQMLFLRRHGSMHLVRDDCLIFHGCLAVDENGDFLPMIIDGRPYTGKALMEKIDGVVQRCFRERRREDLDLLWYLWAGVNSPLFGKDRMATFERYLLADKATHKETKNPYFKLIHETDFCEKILSEFGVDPRRGMIVNGHVPVKIEQGEDPVKRSGKAITIDGAFSEAYGDHGYTLILDCGGIYLAHHHHFESVEDAVACGTDIIPEVGRVKVYGEERRVADTEKGAEIEERISMLRKLVAAYEETVIHEASPRLP